MFYNKSLWIIFPLLILINSFYIFNYHNIYLTIITTVGIFFLGMLDAKISLRGDLR